MATETKLRQLADKECPVYYFYSSERYLVRQAVAAATRILTADSDEDATVLDGAAPEIEQLIMAAGTISFFGTRRVVVLPEIDADRVTTTGLNLRAAPVTGAVLTVLPAATPLETVGLWRRVRVSVKGAVVDGWVSDDYTAAS